MAILAAFMVPHPPLIVPAVGKGGEKDILETTRAYEQVAKEVEKLKPETIIVTSPHAVMYGDYFHISPGAHADGSFADFRAPEIKFSEDYDTELTECISAVAKERDFPAGSLGERNSKLDHGTMVPLWFIRNQYKEGKIVRTGLSGLPLTDHYLFGEIIAEAVKKTGRNVVLIASGDLSHKLQSYGPYGFAKEGPEYDRRIMEVCGNAEFEKLFDFDETFREKAAECGHGSFVIMAGVFDGLKVKSSKLSHQDVTGVGYGICTFYPEGPNEGRHFLQNYERRLEEECANKADSGDEYVKLARSAVEAWVCGRHRIPVPEGLPEDMLERSAGTFVSIHKQGSLRGCIGTITATKKNIAEEIINNAMSASTRDPRFNPIEPKELKFLEISVDVLGPTQDIDSPTELDVKRYGVIVSHGHKRGLLLPNLEGVDTVEQQIDIARRKGGIGEKEPCTLQRFEVIRHY
ncbi:MAG: AmmeMemoRadiSam system protein A [Lachnospiraceae bacterium]|nr:AmmeMemoRadiSam system protein A [Lachnospiraceae bacterium]